MVDIPNAFVQTVVSKEDADHRVSVHIRGPLVDISVSIAPDVYGSYVSTTKTGQKVLIMECLNAVYGTMVAALLYYKKFVKSLVKQGFKLNPYDGCVINKIVKGKQITLWFMLMTASFPTSIKKWLMRPSNGSKPNMKAYLKMAQVL